MRLYRTADGSSWASLGIILLLLASGALLIALTSLPAALPFPLPLILFPIFLIVLAASLLHVPLFVLAVLLGGLALLRGRTPTRQRATIAVMLGVPTAALYLFVLPPVFERFANSPL